jgi:hypothetical protein
MICVLLRLRIFVVRIRHILLDFRFFFAYDWKELIACSGS